MIKASLSEKDIKLIKKASSLSEEGKMFNYEGELIK